MNRPNADTPQIPAPGVLIWLSAVLVAILMSAGSATPAPPAGVPDATVDAEGVPPLAAHNG